MQIIITKIITITKIVTNILKTSMISMERQIIIDLKTIISE